MLEIVTVWLPVPVSHHHPNPHHLTTSRIAISYPGHTGLVESSGYQGLNFPDPRTRRNTICYYTELREDDTGCLLYTSDAADE